MWVAPNSILLDVCVTKYLWFLQAESPSGMNEENEVIMAILRGIYERRQQQHTHIGQVTDNHHQHLLSFYTQGKDWVGEIASCA